MTQNYFQHLEPRAITFLNQDRINEFSNKSRSTFKKISIETLKKEIKPAVTEKYGFEYRQKISKNSIFRKFHIMRILRQ